MARGKLCSGFSNRNRVHTELFLFAMEFELEAIRQQLLNHYLDLRDVGLARHLGFPSYIVLVRFEPRRSACNLTEMKVIGHCDEIAQGRVDRDNVLASHGK